MIAFAHSLWVFITAGVLYGYGYGATQPALNSLAIQLCPADRVGSANATFFSAMDSGFFIGALLWGMISQQIGYEYIYIGSAVSAAAALGYYVFMIPKLSLKISVREQETDGVVETDAGNGCV